MAQSSRSHSRSPSALRVAVMAALIEEPGHGYALTHRLNRRMGPLLHADPRRVYETLMDLEREGLARSAQEASGASRTRRVFSATAKARSLHASWLAERQYVQLAHANIRTLLAFSTPEQAPQLLRLLEEYELDCMEVQEGAAHRELRGGSWSTRMIAAARVGLTEQLRAEIRWVTRARKEIEEHLSEARRPGPTRRN